MMKKKLAIILGAVLALVSVGVWATNASIMWTPYRLAPASIAPGETLSASVSFVNKGPSTINGTKFALRVDGDANRIITVGLVSFPQSIKNGDSLTVPLTITVPSSEHIGVVHGELLLVELHPDGSVKEVVSDTLPIEITVSSFHLPPAPDTAEDEATILGVDSDANGVPDRVDRWIGFNAPESEKKRA
ncbi:hypothetical protein L0Y69_03580, partial [bacterium]|nr:hypothetical protein [bacterium]